MSDPRRTMGRMGWQIELDLLPGKKPVRMWRAGEPSQPRFREVGYGTWGLIGWYAYRAGGRWAGAWTCTDEREACDLLDRWLVSREGAGRTWVEVLPDPADNDTD